MAIDFACLSGDRKKRELVTTGPYSMCPQLLGGLELIEGLQAASLLPHLFLLP